MFNPPTRKEILNNNDRGGDNSTTSENILP